MLTVTTLLKSAATDRDNLDPRHHDPATLQWIFETGLGPLLHFCSRNNPNMDTTSREYGMLHGAQLTARVLTGALLDAVNELFDTPPACSHEITLLKGISLCQKHYPEPHLRTMGDIDLLVPTQCKPQIETALRDLGYRQSSEYPEEFYEAHHHSMPFYHPAKRIWVEVHTALFPNTASVSRDKVFMLDNIEKNIVPFVRHGQQTNHLSDELNIAYLCSHWAESFNRIRGLIPMLDVIYILKNRNTTFDWDKTLASLEGSVAASHLYLMLSFLERHNLVSVPSEILQRLSRLQKILNRANNMILHRLLNNYFIKGKPFTSIASESNISITWGTLLTPCPPEINFLRIPWNLLFPPANAQRLSPAFQLNRIRSAMGWNRKPDSSRDI